MAGADMYGEVCSHWGTSVQTSTAITFWRAFSAPRWSSKGWWARFSIESIFENENTSLPFHVLSGSGGTVLASRESRRQVEKIQAIVLFSQFLVPGSRVDSVACLVFAQNFHPW